MELTATSSIAGTSLGASRLIDNNAYSLTCADTSFGQGRYVLNGSTGVLEITGANAYAIGDTFHMFTLTSPTRIVQNDGEWWIGVWITTISVFTKQ